MSDLPLSIDPGDPEHIDHHERLHELVQRLEGVDPDFLVAGVAQGVLADRPAAADSDQLLYFASDVPALTYSDGTSWHQAIMGSTSNQWSAIQSFDEDAFFGSGRPWVAVMHPDFGATGDGITNDRQAIQDAADACPDGGTLWFDYGIYYVPGTDGVYVSGRSNLVYAGPLGGGAVLKKSPTNNYRWLRFDDCTDVTLWGLGFDYNGGGQFGGVTFYATLSDGSASGMFAYHCHVYDSNPQAWVSGVNADRYWLVTNSAFVATNVEVAHCQVADVGMEFDHVDGVHIHDNVFRDTKSTCPVGSFKVGAGAAKVCKNLHVHHNEFYDYGTNGVVVRNESSGINDLTIENLRVHHNLFQSDTVDPRYAVAVGSFHGNAAATGNTIRTVVVTDNEIIITVARAAENRAVYIKHDQVGLRISGYRVERNHVRIDSPNAADTEPVFDVRAAADGASIRGNEVEAACPKHYSLSNVDNGWFTDNTSIDCLTTPVTIGGGTTVRCRGNIFVNAPATHYSGASTGDWLYDNEDTQQLAATAAVQAWAHRMEMPAGSNITTIAGGIVGQRLVIYCAAGVARTLFHNGNGSGAAGSAMLAGSVQYAMGAQDSVTLEKRADGYWYELARANI